MHMSHYSTYAVQDVELDGTLIAIPTTDDLAVLCLDRLQTIKISGLSRRLATRPTANSRQTDSCSN